MPAAMLGLMAIDIKGTANMAIGQANPHFEIQKIIQEELIN